MSTHPTANSPSPPPTWSVYRQDDNGHEFLVSSGHTREEAEALVREFEARGHKQLYWAAEEDRWSRGG